ncbi:APC family permease [Sandarakinorhabdus sp.]|uniref:APC family permease n=1 Tax=Sandarakinorhabdus sp. TaxID=1916663 RepID=UPI00286E701F|nr:APC family permease [Sandarakinorhabdus sp.]
MANAQKTGGLVAGIGLWAMVGNLIGIVIGGGIFTLPGEIAAAVGAWAPLAYAVAALIVGTILLCFAEAAARVPASGGVYGFTTAAFGPYWGWLTGALTWAGNILASGALANAAVSAAGALWPALAADNIRPALIALIFLVLLAINSRNVGTAARFVGLFTVSKLVPLTLFVLVGAWFVAPSNLVLPLAANAAGGHADIGRAAIMAIFIYTGMEGGLAVAGEVRDPARTIPRAIAIALTVVALVYVSIQAVAQGLIGNALAGAPAPLATAFASVSPGLGAVMAVGAVISIFGFLTSESLNSPRIVFAAARNGLLPRWLATIEPNQQVPRNAVAAHVVVAAGLAISGSFETLIIVATLATLSVYAIGCAAALRLRALGVEQAGPVAELHVLKPAAVVAFAAIAWLMAQSTRAEASALAIYVGVVSLLFLARRKGD